MGLTLTEVSGARTVMGNKRAVVYTCAFDASYPTGGEALTPGNLGLSTIDFLIAEARAGYVFTYDHTNSKLLAYRTATLTPGGSLDSISGGTPAGTNSAPGFTGTANAGTAGVVTDNDNAATLGHAIYVLPQTSAPVAQVLVAESAATGLVKDSDTAATEGVALYVVVDDPNWSSGYQLGHFEFVSPTNVNGTCTIANGAATLTIFDDDAAATNGVAVRAVAASGGLEATTGASKDILVPISTGKFIHVNHATTGATPELYFDEDAANTYERIRGVIVDNLDEPYKLFVASLAATEDVPLFPIVAGPRLASLVTVGPKPFSYTVGASGPEITIASRPDAASLPGAVALYAQAAGAGFNAANYGKEDLFVPTSTGEFIKVAYAASPAGVQVYSYPEGATANLTLQAVVVDNLDETFSTEAAVGWKRDTPAGTVAAPTFTGNALAGHTHTLTGSATTAAALAEVGNAVNLSAVTGVRIFVVGS